MMGASDKPTGLSSATEPCSTVSALTGFDPSRFDDVASGCGAITERLEDLTISPTGCREIEQLEGYHDNLVREVANLASLLRYTATAIATEARRAETPQDGSVHESAGPKDIAQ